MGGIIRSQGRDPQGCPRSVLLFFLAGVPAGPGQVPGPSAGPNRYRQASAGPTVTARPRLGLSAPGGSKKEIHT